MFDTSKCSEAAEQCRHQALTSDEPDVWLRLAEDWEKMAAQAETLLTWADSFKQRYETLDP